MVSSLFGDQPVERILRPMRLRVPYVTSAVGVWTPDLRQPRGSNGALYGAKHWPSVLTAEAVYRIDGLEALLEVYGSKSCLA